MLLYLVPIVGVTVTVHTCAGKITSSSFSPFGIGQGCTCSDNKMEKDCCKDETASLKLDDEQQKTQFIFFSLTKLNTEQADLPGSLIFDTLTSLFSTGFGYNLHPPDDKRHPLYLRYRVFQI